MTGRPRAVLATRNPHKVAELRRILVGALPDLPPDALVGVADLPRLGLPDPGDVVEHEVTFAGNALLKARALAAATRLVAVADDSGLGVAVLGGAPGVFSARWAGAHGDDGANLRLLLAQLADVPDAHRRAWFACAAALVTPDGREEVAEGRLEGVLAREPRGGGGFGYDPVLVPDGESRTCAELSHAEKDAISHRGRAFRALAPRLAAVLPGDL
ncbi:MAG: non-canonical purine NTP pyrophosphatase [Kineosporiaceae bacterium]